MPSTTLSLVSTVSNDRSLLTSLRFSVQFSHSSPAALWDFFFVFPTFFFHYDVPGCGLLYVHGTWSSLCFLDVEIVFFIKFGKFSTRLLLIFFSVPLSPLTKLVLHALSWASWFLTFLEVLFFTFFYHLNYIISITLSSSSLILFSSS